MKEVGIVAIAILVLMFACLTGCDGKYHPKDEGEKAIVKHFEENSVNMEITNIERLEDFNAPLPNGTTATLYRYKIYVAYSDNKKTKVEFIIDYDPNSKEMILEKP